MGVGKDVVGHGDEGVFLAEHSAVFADEGQAVNVGIYDDAEVEGAFTHAAHDALEILFEGLGIVGEVAVGLAVEYLVADAEGFKQSREDDAADAVDGIHADAELGLADGFAVNEAESKHALYMALVEGVVFDVATQMIYVGIFEGFGLSDAEHLVAGFLVEELAFAVEQLQGVPLAGVVGGGDDDAAVGSAHADGKFGGRRGGESDVDYVVAVAHECAADYVLDHLA